MRSDNYLAYMKNVYGCKDSQEEKQCSIHLILHIENLWWNQRKGEIPRRCLS